MPEHGAAPVCGHGVKPSVGQCEPWGVGCTAAWGAVAVTQSQAGCCWGKLGACGESKRATAAAGGPCRQSCPLQPLLQCL